MGRGSFLDCTHTCTIVSPLTVTSTPAWAPNSFRVTVPCRSLSKLSTSRGQTVTQMPQWMQEVFSLENDCWFLAKLITSMSTSQ